MERLTELVARAKYDDREMQPAIERASEPPEDVLAQLLAAFAEFKNDAPHEDVRTVKKNNPRGMYELSKLHFASHYDYDAEQLYIIEDFDAPEEADVDVKDAGLPKSKALKQYTSYIPSKNFELKIEELRWYFRSLGLVEKLKFIGNLQNNPPEDTKNYPIFRKFVNECIRIYNSEVRKHNSEMRMKDLRAYFNELNFPTKLEFIRKLQATPPAIRNQQKYRGFTNECISDYNAEVRQRNFRIINNKVARNPHDAANIISTQFDAKVAQLHYYGSSCRNCRHLNKEYCGSFSGILPSWKEKGYNVCQKWEQR